MTQPITVVAPGPPRADATPVETLVHPLSSEQFLSRHWQRLPVHLTGWADRFPALFDRAALRRVLEQQHDLGLSVRVSGDHLGDDGGAGAHVVVDSADVADHLRAGTSLCVDPVDRADAAVAALAASLKAGLGHIGPVAVKCYLSTPGFGFNTHFDAQVVTTLQIEGTKRWRVSRTPAVRFPLQNAFLDAGGEIRYIGRSPGSLRPWERPPFDPDDLVEVVLRPGDVLCLPAGTWHEAKAVGGASLALNFSFAPVDVAGLLLSTIRPALQESESWRAGVPAGADSLEVLAQRADELSTALRELAADPETMTTRMADLATTAPGAAAVQPAAVAHAAAVAASAEWTGHRVQCLLAVSNAVKAAEWYGRVLGSQVVTEIPEFGWIEISTNVPGLTLGLTEMSTNVSNRGAVLDFEVDDVERIRGVLQANGVRVDTPPSEIEGVARVLSARDPDGNQLMFFEPHDTGST
jgi:ribosomal protein L16 Arg81 hydroxylase/predicted enzyme related to lactoylglutathione lyase